MPMLAVVLVATFAMTGTSLAALMFAVVAQRTCPRPNIWVGRLELAFFVLSFCTSCSFATTLWFAW